MTRAARECFTSLINASGYLVPRRAAAIMFVAPGYRVTAVLAKAGDTVKRGDVVARLAPTSPPPDKAKASGDTKAPGDTRAPGDRAPGDTKAPADLALTSMASGLVLQGTAFEGMPTSEKGGPLFTLAVDGVIEASVDVPSVHILELKVGQVARLTTRDGRVLDGLVRRTPAAVDPASQMGATRLSIASAKGLEPSRFVRATIEARRSCGVGVPTAALRRTSAGPIVQVVKDDRILDRAVRLGLAGPTDSEVASGLAEGDLVVASTGSLREGDPVKPVFADLQDAR